MITWTAWCRCVRDVTGYCACPLCLAAAAPAIRRARRARRRVLLRRIREDRRPTGGRWYGRRDTDTEDHDMTHGNAPRCPKCGTANFTIRKVCRNEECAHGLVLHPERDIDDAVRWDAEDARRYDDAAMAEPRTP